MDDDQAESRAADPQRIQFMWPEDGVGPLVVAFEFEDREGAWQCHRVTIERADYWRGDDVLDPKALAPLRLGRMLRQARAGIWFQRVLETALLAEAHMAQGVPPEEIKRPKITKAGHRDRRGAASLSPEYLAQVADVFNAAENRPGPTKPVLDVMERFDLPRSTAARHIRRARERHLIGPRRNRGNLGGSREPRQVGD